MAECWTCGAQVESLQYACSSCRELKEIQNLQKKVASFQGDVSDKLNYLAQVQREGFQELTDTLSSGLSEIASAIEWGFGEIVWHLQQQTGILRSIDHTLKTPSETQANEYRKMAEELRRRGVFDESEEFYLKALELNRLDYRIYLGLAETYLQSNKFDKAKSALERSLPHAPDEIMEIPAKDLLGPITRETFINVLETEKESKELREIFFKIATGEHTGINPYILMNWKSYSYRLIGHIYACNGEYGKAAEDLKHSVELSSAYGDAHYDYAQYNAQIGNNETCLLHLEGAILRNPVYWYLAKEERHFDPLRNEVEDLQVNIKLDAFRALEPVTEKSQSGLSEASKAISAANNALVLSEEQGTLKSVTMYKEAEELLRAANGKAATDDYESVLAALPIADKSLLMSEEAKAEADKEKSYYEDALAKKQQERAEKVTKTRIGIVGSILGCLLGGAIGCVIGIISAIIPGIVVIFVVLFIWGGEVVETVTSVWMGICTIAGAILGAILGVPSILGIRDSLKKKIKKS